MYLLWVELFLQCPLLKRYAGNLNPRTSECDVFGNRVITDASSEDEVTPESGKSPGAVTHACNPALWEAKVGGSLEVRSWRPAWPTW